MRPRAVCVSRDTNGIRWQVMLVRHGRVGLFGDKGQAYKLNITGTLPYVPSIIRPVPIFQSSVAINIQLEQVKRVR